jgi:site-specific recombinase XerD
VKGSPLSGDAIYDVIIRRTAAHFGRAVNAHLFRDGAATFWAIAAPAKIEGASALLGHSDVRTMKFYNQLAQWRRGGDLRHCWQKECETPDPFLGISCHISCH